MSTIDPSTRLHGQVSPPVWLPSFKAWARSPDVVLVADAAGHIGRLNRPLGSITPADLRNQPIWSWTSEALRAPLRAAVQHAFHPGLAQVLEADFPAGSGRRWYRIQILPLGDGPDRVALLHCIDTDAHHRELERLQQGEHLMRDTEGLAHLGTWYWDITQPNATWSEELYHIYGLDPATHTPTYDDYLTRVHPEDVARVKAATEAVFNDFRSYSHDERIRHADGSWRHLHTWARPVLHDDGSLKALQGVCLDITQRKLQEVELAASQDRQRSIIDYAGLGIASIAADGRIEQGNARFEEVTGSGDTCAERFTNGNDVTTTLAEMLEGDTSARTVAVTPRAATDRRVRLLLTRVKQRGEPFFVAVAQDVTAEVVAREADSKIRRLEARHAAHARVVGMAGHEIKNPLTPILMQLALLRRGDLGDLDDRQAAALAKIEHQAGRIQVLLQDLLDASSAGAGGMPLHVAAVDAAQLVRGATESHQATAASFEVGLHVHAPAALHVEADASRILQVVDNLVINALRFTPSGRRVDVSAEDEGDWWRIEVADEGVGIPADQQEDIFEAYVSRDIAAPHRLNSTGLGLFVVRAIVEAHGGTVQLTSAPGRGTSIIVRLPKHAKA